MTANEHSHKKLTTVELTQTRKVLVQYARCNGCNAHTASDVVQSALAAIINRPEEQHTLAYLYEVLRNKIYDIFRRRKREKAFPTDKLSIVDNRDARTLLDKLIAQSEAAAFVNALMTRLNDREQRLFQLIYFQERHREEVCEIMGLSCGQYGNSMRQIRKKAMLTAVELGIESSPAKEEQSE